MSNNKEIATPNEVLVEVKGLGKKFCKDLKTSLWYGVKDLVNGIRGKHNGIALRPKEFWAVKDVSFQLRRGECLGLIGHNGAGKSTLLKILNGLINPDAGSVTMGGRISALIELGAGFNSILSGRENIYNNGAILGFSRNEIDSKLEAIIAFAELEEFIDMPVQHYSSGMKVRLGFAVAAQMEPDVLIIDEVLAVGDLGFTLKCFKTIDTILPHTAIIFVSHNMPMVSRICNQIILMEHGCAQFQGNDVGKAIDLYYRRFTNNESNVIFSDDSIKLKSVALLNAAGAIEGLSQLNWGDKLQLAFTFKVTDNDEIPKFQISIYDKEQRPVALLAPNALDADISKTNGLITFTVTHKQLQLSKGIYSINILVSKMKNKEPLLRINNILVFQMIHKEEIWPPFLLETNFIKTT